MLADQLIAALIVGMGFSALMSSVKSQQKMHAIAESSAISPDLSGILLRSVNCAETIDSGHCTAPPGSCVPPSREADMTQVKLISGDTFIEANSYTVFNSSSPLKKIKVAATCNAEERKLCFFQSSPSGQWISPFKFPKNVQDPGIRCPDAIIGGGVGTTTGTSSGGSGTSTGASTGTSGSSTGTTSSCTTPASPPQPCSCTIYCYNNCRCFNAQYSAVGTTITVSFQGDNCNWYSINSGVAFLSTPPTYPQGTCPGQDAIGKIGPYKKSGATVKGSVSFKSDTNGAICTMNFVNSGDNPIGGQIPPHKPCY